MNAKQLIKLLQKFDPNIEVFAYTKNGALYEPELVVQFSKKLIDSTYNKSDCLLIEGNKLKTKFNS